MDVSSDTIAAIATPLGVGGLGVIRLSGPQAFSVADRIFSNPSQKLSDAPPDTLHHGWVKRGDALIDEAVAAVFKSPRSYTGENVVEISCHGSPFVLREILRLCLEHGARLAQPGEFTQRAYLHGKMDLSQAEAVAELIHSQSEAGRAVAASHLKGTLSKRIRKIRQELLNVFAQVEANLDFVEEDIPGLPPKEFIDRLTQVQRQIDVLLKTSLRGRIYRDGIRMVLVGKPNVGKSSLFNALLSQDRAIVTPVPGTTRDTIQEKMVWEGLTIALTDTAGLRSTRSMVETKGTERTHEQSTLADVILWVLDSSAPLGPEDEHAAQAIQTQKTIAVLNKSDKKLLIDQGSIKTKFSISETVNTSAITGDGLMELKETVLNRIRSSIPETAEGEVVTNERHIRHLEKASAGIQKALAASTLKKSEESISVDLRDALDELGRITGQNAGDDVLATIFSQFCIGK